MDMLGKYTQAMRKTTARISKFIDIQLRSRHFNQSALSTHLAFFSIFQLACVANGLHAGVAMWMIQFSVRRPASTDLQGRTQDLKLTTSGKKRHANCGMLTTYCQVFNYFLNIYATKENISRASHDIHRYNQLKSRAPTEYGNSVWKKMFPCRTVSDEDRIKGLFVEAVS